MKIIVCIKQVPDTTDIKWTENNTIQREGVESVINPFDVYAIEKALQIKKALDNVEITVLIALGCDSAVLVSDKKFAGADTYATAKTLSSAIKTKLSDFDLIICGQFAVDGDTAQTGPEIAAQLDIPQITYVKNIDRIEEKSMYAQRELEDGIETVKIDFPSLICVVKNFDNLTRPTINGFKKAQNLEIENLSMENVGLTPEDVGIKGSPTFVSKAFRPLKNREACVFVENSDELLAKIKEFGGIV